jgi:hypothetical protein
MSKLPEPEALLELGLVALAGMLVGGLVLLAGGRAAGDLWRHQRHAEAPPAPGHVPAERHQHIAAVAPR